MIVKVVYGCPCSGKSTFIRENAGENDLIYDYDDLLLAATTRTKHLTDRHPAHYTILSLRKQMIDEARDGGRIETLWLQCGWPTDTVRKMLDGIDSEDVFIRATKQQCYERLDGDETRPDKDEWRAVIDSWFAEHEEHGKESDQTVTKFWNWVSDESGNRVLRLEGPIDSELFWGDEVTPQDFRQDLYSGEGDVTVYINSPGGNVFAAAEIYTMIKEYPGKVTVKIDAIAASAASVIAMAGDEVLMSPVAMLMIHDPSTIAYGNAKDMEKAIATLAEVKETIINAYQAKTGLSRNKLSKLMEDETWMNARKAKEYGFADAILFEDDANDEGADDGIEMGERRFGITACWNQEATAFSARATDKAILDNLGCLKNEADEDAAETEETEITEETPAETEETEVTEETKETPAETEETAQDEPAVEDAVVIGMDGKTKDGAVPYDILREKLEWLK